MPALKTYDLFVSHAWRYNDDYYRLVKLLEDASNFYMRNYSVPKHDPAIDPNTQAGKARLKAALEAQIRPVNCVLILAGMYRWMLATMSVASFFLNDTENAQKYEDEFLELAAAWERVTFLNNKKLFLG
ncbi:TIR domain-containing protein [Ferrovibrio sp.]|uniref:TIR domain-containing protein n=1 Tax=Ferrovibrio sp. TaxID=1917215 RepID=UPI0026221D05|nr:TIR domain-containing protein [Ferrovibrio sp.]